MSTGFARRFTPVHDKSLCKRNLNTKDTATNDTIAKMSKLKQVVDTSPSKIVSVNN